MEKAPNLNKMFGVTHSVKKLSLSYMKRENASKISSPKPKFHITQKEAGNSFKENLLHIPLEV